MTVTCVDNETGESETRIVPDNDHLVVTCGRAFISAKAHYPGTGTTQYTIKLDKGE